MMKVTGKTKFLGVIGDPVEHSLSPTMQNCALAKLNLDYVYLPLPVKAEGLEKALAGFEAIGLVGFNVTIPHKQNIMPLLNKISAIAQMVGAVNTVWRTDNGWEGTNTDIAGFIAPLQGLKRWQGSTPVILGHGGAARAVVVGCSELGCGDIQVVGRNEEKLLQFYKSWQDTPLQNKVKVHPWRNLSRLLPQADLLVNTTPVGMYPHVDNSPVDRELMTKVKQSAIAYDLIYNPRPTQFLQIAQQQGLQIIDGTEMLVEQGASALEIWVKQSAPVETMREALLAALKR